jgi:hypothetical protein
MFPLRGKASDDLANGMSDMWWLIVDINSAIGLLHSVDVSDVGISEVHAVSIFMIEVFNVAEFETHAEV